MLSAASHGGDVGVLEGSDVLLKVEEAEGGKGGRRWRASVSGPPVVRLWDFNAPESAVHHPPPWRASLPLSVYRRNESRLRRIGSLKIRLKIRGMRHCCCAFLLYRSVALFCWQASLSLSHSIAAI